MYALFARLGVPRILEAVDDRTSLPFVGNIHIVQIDLDVARSDELHARQHRLSNAYKHGRPLAWRA